MLDVRLPQQDVQYFLRWLRGLYFVPIHFCYFAFSTYDRYRKQEINSAISTLRTFLILNFSITARQWNPEAAEKMLRQVC